jgi:hypothetical protein
MLIAAGPAESLLTEGEEAKSGSSRAVSENSKMFHDGSGISGNGTPSSFTEGFSNAYPEASIDIAPMLWRYGWIYGCWGTWSRSPKRDPSAEPLAAYG